MTLLALPQPGAARGAGLASAARLELEHRAERQAEQARAADAQQVAAGDPEVRSHRSLPGCPGTMIIASLRLTGRLSGSDVTARSRWRRRLAVRRATRHLLNG